MCTHMGVTLILIQLLRHHHLLTSFLLLKFSSLCILGHNVWNNFSDQFLYRRPNLVKCYKKRGDTGECGMSSGTPTRYTVSKNWSPAKRTETTLGSEQAHTSQNRWTINAKPRKFLLGKRVHPAQWVSVSVRRQEMN